MLACVGLFIHVCVNPEKSVWIMRQHLLCSQLQRNTNHRWLWCWQSRPADITYITPAGVGCLKQSPRKHFYWRVFGVFGVKLWLSKLEQHFQQLCMIFRSNISVDKQIFEGQIIIFAGVVFNLRTSPCFTKILKEIRFKIINTWVINHRQRGSARVYVWKCLCYLIYLTVNWVAAGHE